MGVNMTGEGVSITGISSDFNFLIDRTFHCIKVIKPMVIKSKGGE